MHRPADHSATVAAQPAQALQRPNPSATKHDTCERTLLYQTIAEHFETRLELAGAGQFDGQGGNPPVHLMGVAFCKVSRDVVGFEVETLGGG